MTRTRFVGLILMTVMVTLALVAVLGLGLHNERKDVIPNCADYLAPGTLCNWVPRSELVFNLTDNTGQKLPFHVDLPQGFRGVHVTAEVTVSPTGQACDASPDDTYRGEGGVSITCDGQ